jgi:hypothetical protein
MSPASPWWRRPGWSWRPHAAWVADNRGDHPRRSILRLTFGRSSLIAAAALAGGVVCWRVVEQRRSRQLSTEVDEAIAQGRAAADRLLDSGDRDDERFDQR